MTTAKQALAEYEAGPIPTTCEEVEAALLSLLRAEPPAPSDVRTQQRMGVIIENLGARRAAFQEQRQKEMAA